MSAAPRVVLDTNVVLSALVFRGGSAGLVRLAWQRGDIVPLVHTSTAHELVRVLDYPKFHLSKAEQTELLADYLPYTETVRSLPSLPRLPECRDPLDKPFMQLAMAGKAQVLVSGDSDLLSIADAFERTSGCAIVTLEAFCKTHCSS